MIATRHGQREALRWPLLRGASVKIVAAKWKDEALFEKNDYSVLTFGVLGSLLMSSFPYFILV